MRRKYFLLIALVIVTFGHIVKRSKCNPLPAKPRKPTGSTKETMEGFWHVASIRLRPLDNPFGNGHICSGTLFAVNKILTSADCLIQDMKMFRFFKPSQLRIVLGIIDRYRKLEDTVVISSGVKYAYHPYYNIETGANDISVIFIQQGILKNHPFIKPMPLIQDPPEVGVTCKVSSWSYTENAVATSSHLADSKMLVLPRQDCTQTKLEGLICVESNSSHAHDGCWSELGEGLVCDLSLAGIVAYDISCRRHGND